MASLNLGNPISLGNWGSLEVFGVVALASCRVRGVEESRLRRDDMQSIQDSCRNCRRLVLVQGEDSYVAVAGVSVAYPGGLGQGKKGVGQR